MKCSNCREREPYVKFKGAVVCVPCLVGAASAGISGAERLLAMIRRRSAKRRLNQKALSNAEHRR